MRVRTERMEPILASKLNKHRFKVVEKTRIHEKEEVVNLENTCFKQFGIMGSDWLYC